MYVYIYIFTHTHISSGACEFSTSPLTLTNRWEIVPGGLDLAAGSALFDRWHHQDAGAPSVRAGAQPVAGVPAGLSAASFTGEGLRRLRVCLRNLCTYFVHIQ